MIIVVILIGVAYAVLLSRYLAQHLPAGPPARSPIPATPSCTDGVPAAPDASAWTALDDHQLTRLLKDSSS